MKITYDKEADAMYIKIREVPFGSNLNPAPGVILDLDADGALVGIEILAVSQRVSLDDFLNINIQVPVPAGK